MHPYELCLTLNDIDQHRPPIRLPQTNGLVERFIRTVKEEFFEGCQTLGESVASLQIDFGHLASSLQHRAAAS